MPPLILTIGSWHWATTKVLSYGISQREKLAQVPLPRSIVHFNDRGDLTVVTPESAFRWQRFGIAGGRGETVPANGSRSKPRSFCREFPASSPPSKQRRQRAVYWITQWLVDPASRYAPRHEITDFRGHAKADVSSDGRWAASEPGEQRRTLVFPSESAGPSSICRLAVCAWCGSALMAGTWQRVPTAFNCGAREIGRPGRKLLPRDRPRPACNWPSRRTAACACRASAE